MCYILNYYNIFIGSKLAILAENHKIVYKDTRCQPVQDQWPPNQPYTIVNVALIHHEGEQTQQELIDMSMRNVSTVERLSSHHPRVTKRITDIFRSTQKRILIEGAPGIGKTVLAKEIAYCWATGEILTDRKLFLLFIRDPNLHCVSSITELVHYLNNDYLSDSEVEVAVDELRESKGSGIVLVIDGYDECPSNSKLKGFIDKLVEGKRLPMCMVVITSRPTASLLLRQLVNQRIEILGLAKKEQDQYISESLKQSPEKIIRLQKYLKQQPIINSLIYVPLHLSVLLYLFKRWDSLPETLTEMNELFIIHTIYRHLTKGRQFLYIQIDKITDLPEPELTIVYQLSKLAYNGLCHSKLVFTYDEMKGACPKIDETPGAINGFGLLQTVECYHQKGAATGKAISLNFLHFTMQEYLAALHVSTLPIEQQSSLMEYIFWEGKFNFMWVMYVGIVGPQSTGLKTAVNVHVPQYREYARKHLFLFQCYLELKDANLMPEAITSIFSDGNINLSNGTLLPHHIMSLTVFMMRSTTQWKSLNLSCCSIGSNGMSILAKFFVDFKERVVTIKYINLRNNRLTSLWGTHLDQDHTDVNSGILQSVEDLDLSLNLLEISSISECLKINSTLCKLNLSSNNITDEGAKKLAEAIQVNTTLQELNMSSNKITDEGAKQLGKAIEVNRTLQELNISSNKITDEGAKQLGKAIEVNRTLQELNISKNWISKEGVMRIVEACTINRTLHKLVCTHNNLSKSGLAAINEYIRKENAVQIFDASWNSLCSKSNRLAFKTTFELLDIQQKLQSDYGNINYYYIKEELWYVDEITDPKFVRKFLQCCLDVQHVNVTGTTMTDDQMSIFCDCLMNNSTLTELNLSSDQITDEVATRLAEAIEVNKTLQKLNISKNWISKEGVMRIVEACTINRTLHKLVCTHNNLSKSGLAVINEYIGKENAVQIFEASYNTVIASSRCGSQLVIPTFQSLRRSPDGWENNLLDYDKQVWLVYNTIWKNVPCRFTHDSLTELNLSYYSMIPNNALVDIIQGIMQVYTLQKLNISNNKISDDGAIAFSECLKTNTTLIELDMSSNNITCKGASVIAEAIQVNTALQKLNISHNEISDDGAIAFIGCLETNTTLIELESGNNITCKVASVIAEAIQVNTALQKLNISHNEISDDGAIAFSECLKTNTTLIELDMSWNNITCKGASVIVEAIQVNTALQKLNISKTEISDDGVIAFSECLKTNTTLIELDMSWNNITCKVASVIAEAIQVNTALQKLNISLNQISDDGAIAFSECLKTNTTLIELDMSWNNITCKVASVIAEAIQVNTALQKLNISHNKISDDGAIAFSECLKTNTTLIELDMSGNNITCKVASVIAEAIQVNTALQKLNISHNKISDDGVIAFSECLKTNTTLIELDMSLNNITCKGASVIAEAIQVNTALQKLNILFNEISDDGAIAFSKCLKTNTTLIKLNMSGNNISYSILQSVEQAIEANNKQKF